MAPRGYFTRNEAIVDDLGGMLLRQRHFYGRIQLPAVAAARDLAPDLILLYEGHMAAASLPRWRRAFPAARLVLYVHNPISRRILGPELRSYTRHADGVIFVGSGLRDSSSRRLAPIPSAVIGNGVDTDTFNPGDRRPFSAQRPVRLAYVGQVTPHKGVHVLVEAFTRLEPGLDVECVILGSSHHQPDLALTEYEEQLRASTKGRPGIRFEPFSSRTHVAEVMRWADIVVVPSVWQEPFGMVALEAMSCGAAVIASDSPGLREAGGDVATYVPAEDPTAIARAITDFAGDPTALAEVSAEGIRQAQSRGWSRTYESMMQFCGALRS